MSGHTPPPLARARILEVGSALGGNLTPIAASLPHAECIGVDPFVEQTEQANVRARRAGIQNVTYLPIGVEELEGVEGSFDYIICHGLLSWIPPQAQHATFELCARRLSPQGLAYISYNTYPRWHQLMYIRDALRWRGRHLKAGEAFEEEARRSLAFFAEYSSTSGEASTRSIFSQAHQSLMGKPDYYLAHEYLLEENHPFYFHEVIERAGLAGGDEAHGLCYLADLSLNVQRSFSQLNGAIQRELKLMGDGQLALEQNLDFIFNRSIRRSLFIRADSPRAGGVRGCPQWANAESRSAHRALELEQVASLSLSAPFLPIAGSACDPLVPQEWRHRHTDARHRLRDPLAQCLLLLASLSWPQPLPEGWPEQVWSLYESLVEAPVSPSERAESWRRALSILGFLELISPPMSEPPALLQAPPERGAPLPRVAPHLTSPNVALERLLNPSSEWLEVSNLYHETTLASPALGAILPLLNGDSSEEDVLKLIEALTLSHPELFSVSPLSGAALVWPKNGLKSLNAKDKLYYLIQEAYELALLTSGPR